jgi:signal transduction histidine kinase
MDSSSFFANHLIEIYFLYGLAFFLTGVVFLLEAGRFPVFPSSQAIPFLSSFGLIHGAHEWIEMFQLMGLVPIGWTFELIRLFMLAFSFYLLVEFGIHSIIVEDDDRRRWAARGITLALFLIGQIVVWVNWFSKPDAWVAAADAWCRYSLAIPGAVLTAVGLFRQGRALHRERSIDVVGDLQIAGLAFLLYGFPGQLFVRTSPLPPSNVLNGSFFFQIFHFPVQLFRTVMAVFVVIFTIRALRSIELARRQRVEELYRTRAEALKQLDQQMQERERMQREFLRQTVLAQEEERKHIARELHDEAGQALSALSWGLATLEETLPQDAGEAQHQAGELQRLSDQVMVNLRQLTTQLRPAMLDELGLAAALISHADESSARYPFVANVTITGRRRRLPSEIETTLYRIAQEAITNVAKHAGASQIDIVLHFGPESVCLTISDDGAGMEVETAGRAAARGGGWGLVGIRERVQLVDGELDIQSAPDEGTVLRVEIPMPTDSVEAQGRGQ